MSAGGASLAPDLARRIRVLILDADGVLTDGGLYVAEGEGGARELRRFHVHDGIAVHMLRGAGIVVALVSGKLSEPVRARAAELGIEEIHQVDPYEKLAAVEGILGRAGAGWDEAAYLADDLADLPVLRRVGLPAAVANAVPEVREAARWRGIVSGGAGAVRELAEAILRGRGDWTDMVEAFVRECERRWEDGSDA